MSERFLRQLGIYNPADRQHDHVTIIGCGGIGSFAALGVAKLGVPHITLIDPDVVEEHNQPNQLFGHEAVGNTKPEALYETLLQLADPPDLNMVLGPHSQAARQAFAGIVVSGVDSMKSRQAIWDESIKLNPAVKLYIDARLSGEYMVMYAPNPLDLEDQEKYEATLHSDEEGEELSCTARGIIDVGLMVGAIITRHVRRRFMDLDVPKTTIFNMETLNSYAYGWD